MLDSAENLVRLLHARLAPTATLRLSLRLLAARRREVATPPVPLASRAHLELQDAEAAADLARGEQAEGGGAWLAEVVAELGSLELAPERLDDGAFAAMQRSVADQLRGSVEDAEFEAQWRRLAPVEAAPAGEARAADGPGTASGPKGAPANATSAAAPPIDLVVRHATRLSFVAERNGVPLVEAVVVTNRGALPLEGAELRLQVGPDFGPPARFALPRLEPNATFTLATPDVALDRARLAVLTERASGALHVELRCGLAILARQRLAVELLAWNEWTRSLADELLAAFVLPNDPAVAELLAAARDRLRAATGDAAFTGYGGGSRERVEAVVRALAETLPAQQLTYHALPASFEKEGQKLRLPQQLLAHRMGNCIELSLLLAALFEQAGLHALLLLVDGHAVVGAWRIADQFPCVTVDDLATVKKLTEVGDLLWLDATVLVGGGDFAAAVAAARKLLEDAARFQKVVDVKAARGAGIVPLPTPGSVPLGAAAERAGASGATPSGAAIGSASGAQGAVPTAVFSPPPQLRDRLTQWKQQLLDLSLRNRLIHWRDSKRCVVLEAGSLAAIEDHLAESGSFDFAPRSVLSAGDPRAAELAAARGAAAVVAAEQQDLLAQGALLTRHPADELQERLLTLFREDRTHVEESGSSTLFLALGFLEWYESPSSQLRRLAPLLLLPVQLERRGVARKFTLKLRDDEPRLNDALLEKLKSELSIDPEPLRALPQDDHGVDVAALLDRFRQLVARVPRFTVVEEARLGFFSFAKYLLWRDLEEHAEALLESELVRHLVKRTEGGALPDPAFVEARRLDEVVPPTKSRVVLDADSSQLVAIEAAVRGATFVLQGPPGTGKSQTIANVIAGCIAAGKRVLFVAEKRAALEVVANRLKRAGLRSACLELHSQRAAKHEVIGELARTLDEAPTARREDDPLLAERTEQLMRELDGYAAALHRRGPLGFNLYECMGRMARERNAPTLPPLPLPAPLEVDRRGYEERRAAVAELADAAAAAAAGHDGALANHPFALCRAIDHTPLEAREREQQLRELATRLADAKGALAAAASALGLPLPSGLPAARAAVATLRLLAAPLPGRAAELVTRSDLAEVAGQLHHLAVEIEADAAARATLAPRWNETLFTLDLAALEREFAQHGDSFAPLRWLKLRGAWATLTPALRGKAPDVAQTRADLALASAVVARARRFADEASFLDLTIGAAARGVATDRAALLKTAAFLERWQALRNDWSGAGVAQPPVARPLGPAGEAAAQALEAALAALDAALTTVATALSVVPAWRDGLAAARDGLALATTTAQRWLEALPLLRAHARLVRAEEAARALELAPLVDVVRRDALPPAAAPAAFERAFFTTVAEHAIGALPPLRDFDGTRHHARALQFRVEDARLIAAGGRRVVAEWGGRRTLRSDAAFAGSEVETLQREAKKKRRQKSVRRLLAEIPTLLRQLKPCLLMSPQSIAQYLPVSKELFDLVIFDEASQIPTHDAIGALARGRHVVVVGDEKQLPPTSFFERALADDDEEEGEAQDGGLVRDLESILEEAQAAGVPSLPLRWHYRSRDESLIAFSNRHYYGSRLHTFPAAAGGAQGLGVARIDVGGLYDKAGKRTNEAEARAVVAWIVAALADPMRRGKSIGVVTFNQPQQELIEDLLDAALLERPELEPFASAPAHGEPLFIKNLENVQGDERDTMLFSVTYGKDAQGRLSMNFGPLNKRGGERRLNVAITRAREKLVVFTSLRPDEIDLAKTTAPGVRHLRDYLDYAARGPVALAAAVTVDPEAECESELEADIARALEARGHVVDRQVGCSGYRIDLAIRDADARGRHWLGIECDGAAYHSGATARDRDRLRQAVLEGLGWRIHRIWSSDWLERREQELDRVEQALRDAREAAAQAERAAAASAASAADASKVAASAAPVAEAKAAPPVMAAAVVAPVVTPVVAPVVAPVVTPAIAPAITPEVTPPTSEPPLYRAFEVVVVGSRDDLDDPGAALRLEELLLRIVDVEAPLHQKPLLQRAARCLGIGRMSAAIEEQLEARLAALAMAGRLVRRGEFVWAAGVDPLRYDTVRTAAPADGPRPAEQIAPEERAAALRRVLAAGGGGAAEDVAAAAARLFGFKAVQQKTRALFRETLEQLAAAGECERVGDVVRPCRR